MSRFAARFGLLTLPVFLIAANGPGCGGKENGPDGEQDGGMTAPFIAVQGDFACYRTWNTFDGGTGAFDGLGLAGEQRTVYINKLPPHGSAAFPIGTIIVKDTATAQTFAMAKRGGGFNPDVGDWEWFELTTADTNPPSACAPLINWRGTAPPVGMVYGGQFVSCNGCHVQAGPPQGSNDYVAGNSLSLSQF
jgi:hypothetical protein